jgi:hypothetical protein
MVEVREADSSLIVSADDGHVKGRPTFDDDREITPEFESEVYSYYGLQSTAPRTAAPTPATSSEDHRRRHREPDRDELRVQRTEEELAAGTRERRGRRHEGAQARAHRPRADRGAHPPRGGLGGEGAGRGDATEAR